MIDDKYSYLASKFLNYYTEFPETITAPPRLESREFAFLLFKDSTMIRHRAFNRIEDLRKTILALGPANIYYSTAYYARPAEPMEKKGWLGADLCFDIDADHIETSCKYEHDFWKCNACGTNGKGRAPAACGVCGAKKIEGKTWVCEKCLYAAKLEVMKLIDFLKEDFGLDPHDMSVYFSGHRGYHLHVRNEEVLALGDEERKEIVDYVQAVGLNPGYHGLYEKREARLKFIKGPTRDEPGWRGRISRGVYKALMQYSPDELKELGFRQKMARRIVDEREKILRDPKDEMAWDRFGLRSDAWSKIIEKVIRKGALAAAVDTVVTTDLHRLIRMPETINSKTGFRAAKVDMDRIDEFDPFEDAIALKGEQRAFVYESPRFRVGDETFGPFRNEEKVLPMAAAVLLICNDMAVPVD